MINSSGTIILWGAGTDAGSSGWKSRVTALNTMLMLLARTSVSPPHRWSASSHRGDSDGCGPTIVLIVSYHCLELLLPILSLLDCAGLSSNYLSGVSWMPVRAPQQWSRFTNSCTAESIQLKSIQCCIKSWISLFAGYISWNHYRICSKLE